METKFQTSFIPKKPLISNQSNISVRTGTSVLMIISTILFLISLAGAIFSFVWINVLNKNQEGYKSDLTKMEARFPIADIENLKKANTKLDLSNQLLKSHISTPEIFSIISQLTTSNVRFNSLSFSTPDNIATDGVKLTMSGVAKDYYAIAFQSDVFGSSEKYGKNKILKNPVISDVAEDENGSVKFSFSATINPSDLLYDSILNENSDISNESTTSTQ